eukprot:m51a1_g485 hypothetical protein (324) ;mRNA; r:221337-222865
MWLFFIRHGDPDYETNTLTERGVAEATALAQRLATLGITRILSSPSGRVMQTAGHASRALGLPVEQAPWLQEPSHLQAPAAWANGLEAAVVWDIPGHLVHAARDEWRSEDWLAREPYSSISGAADAMQAFASGLDGVLAEHGFEAQGARYRVAASSQRGREERVALFGHNGTVLLALAHLLRLPHPQVFSGFFASPTSVTTFHMDELCRPEEEPKWATPRAMGVADVSHLYAAGMQPNPRGMGKINYAAIPSVLYTSPEVAWVGPAVDDLDPKSVNVGSFPLRANGRSRASDSAEGVCKVVSDKKTGRVVSVHITSWRPRRAR